MGMIFLLAWWLLVGTGGVVTSSIMEEFVIGNEACTKRTLHNVGTVNALGDIEFPQVNTECLISGGMRSTNSMATVQSVATLSNALGEHGFSIELWLSPQASISALVPILSVGQDSASDGECSNNLVISQVPSTNSSYRKFGVVACNRHSVNSGKNLYSSELVLQEDQRLMHLVVSFAFTRVASTATNFVTTAFYLNGAYAQAPSVALPATFGTFDATSWDPSGRLHLFPAYGVMQPRAVAAGALYYVALHNETLTAVQAGRRYADRMPNFPPVPLNTTATIQENGEVGDHSADPAFYGNPIPTAELVSVQLSVVDLEDTAYGQVITGDRPKLFLSSIPAGVTIYTLDGTALTASSAPPTAAAQYVVYDAQTSSYRIRVRPPLDAYSVPANNAPLFSLAYAAVDGVTGTRSSHDSWAAITVTHVDKPPVAVPSQHTCLSRTYCELQLRGTDPDNAIVAAVITALPAGGQLFQAYVNGTMGAQLTVAGAILTLSTGATFNIIYLHTGTIGRTNAHGTVAADVFSFALIDVEGRQSLPADVHITVTTALGAVRAPTTQATAAQDRPHVLYLRGADVATFPRELRVALVSAPQRGKLYHLNDTSHLHPLRPDQYLDGSLPAGNATATVSVVYIGPKGYFSTPSTDYLSRKLNHSADSFAFKVISADGEESLPAVQNVPIKNVNDPTDIWFTYPAGSTEVVIDARTLPAGSGGSRAVTLTGFSIDDPDLGVEPVHVLVTSTADLMVTLNPDHMEGVYFSGSRFCSTPGYCFNEGTASHMGFVATPAALVAVLNGMTVSFAPQESQGIVTVTLYDGDDGKNCLIAKDLGDGSIRDACYNTTLTVQVRLTHTEDDAYGMGNSGGFGSPVLARLMYVGIGLVLCILLVGIRCCLCRCNDRADNSSKNGDDGKHYGDADRGAAPRAGTAARVARSLYSALPMMSPTRPAVSRARPHRRSTMEDDQGSDGGSGGDDIEACRTPPRKAPARTPPCTPGTPASTTKLISQPDPDTRTQSSTTALTRTVVLTHDVISPDGSVTRQSTRVELPRFAETTPQTSAAAEFPHSKAHAKPKAKKQMKAFPELKPLGRTGNSKPHRGRDFTPGQGWGDDPSVSTLSCSIEGPQASISGATHTTAVQSNRTDKFSRTTKHQLAPRARQHNEQTEIELSQQQYAQLGDEWTVHTHRSGRIFYHNSRTGRSTWKAPTEVLKEGI